jgi:festuclavine dehydrogenase
LEIAAKMSKALGRTITHVKLSDEDSTKRFQSFGMTEDQAKFMTRLETTTAGGAEANFGKGGVEELTGKTPMKFDKWVLENKNAWD